MARVNIGAGTAIHQYNTPIPGATIYGGNPGNAYPSRYAGYTTKNPAVRSTQSPPNQVALAGSFSAYKAGLPAFPATNETRHGLLSSGASRAKTRVNITRS